MPPSVSMDAVSAPSGTCADASVAERYVVVVVEEWCESLFREPGSALEVILCIGGAKIVGLGCWFDMELVVR